LKIQLENSGSFLKRMRMRCHWKPNQRSRTRFIRATF